MKRKGTGKAGGGLKARIEDFLGFKGGSPSGPADYRFTGGITHHKPGSQNDMKGGTGESRKKGFPTPKYIDPKPGRKRGKERAS